MAIIILFGFIAPILSIMGPTKEALGKNLRASLDATQRNNTEATSVSVTRRHKYGISGQELLMAVFLICFGLMTYYVVPHSLLHGHFGVFFFVMNFVLTGMCVGMVLIAVICMHKLQLFILRLLLCCKKDDKRL